MSILVCFQILFLRCCAPSLAQMVQVLLAHRLAGKFTNLREKSSASRKPCNSAGISNASRAPHFFALKALPRHCAAPTPEVPPILPDSAACFSYQNHLPDSPRAPLPHVDRSGWSPAAASVFVAFCYVFAVCGDFCRFLLIFKFCEPFVFFVAVLPKVVLARKSFLFNKSMGSLARNPVLFVKIVPKHTRTPSSETLCCFLRTCFPRATVYCRTSNCQRPPPVCHALRFIAFAWQDASLCVTPCVFASSHGKSKAPACMSRPVSFL